jgi:hypothetical protein
MSAIPTRIKAKESEAFVSLNARLQVISIDVLEVDPNQISDEILFKRPLENLRCFSDVFNSIIRGEHPPAYQKCYEIQKRAINNGRSYSRNDTNEFRDIS